MRTGSGLAKKLGMTRIFSEDGRHVPVTVLQLDGLPGGGQRTSEKMATPQLQLGVGKAKVKRTTESDARPFCQGFC
jgi:large subunit ribosomal protein L3